MTATVSINLDPMWADIDKVDGLTLHSDAEHLSRGLGEAGMPAEAIAESSVTILPAPILVAKTQGRLALARFFLNGGMSEVLDAKEIDNGHPDARRYFVLPTFEGSGHRPIADFTRLKSIESTSGESVGHWRKRMIGYGSVATGLAGFIGSRYGFNPAALTGALGFGAGWLETVFNDPKLKAERDANRAVDLYEYRTSIRLVLES